MSINLGSNSFGLYLGSTKISEAYVGSVKILSAEEPSILPAKTIRFQFSNASFVPTTNSSTTGSNAGTSMEGTWTRVSSSPNVWDWYYDSSDWGGASLTKGMFQLSSKLHNTNFSIIEANFSGVTRTSYMFSSTTYSASSIGKCICDKLISVNNFTNTRSITLMEHMFRECTSLTSVPLFNTSSVTSMYDMFNYCTSLASVPLFNTRSTTNMSNMFTDCTHLTSVPLFNTSNVTNMSVMFTGCTSLTSVPLFNTSSVTNMSFMFYACTSLTSVPLFDTSSVTNMLSMFNGCRKVESGALALYQQASTQAIPPTSHNYAFRNCGADTTTGAAELAQIPSDWK